MPFIARDSTGSNPYRLFGVRPLKLQMISHDGDRLPGQFTWSSLEQSGRLMGVGKHDGKTYAPLGNHESTELPADASPIELEPGEGPVEVRLVLVEAPAPRTFQGAGI